MYKIHIWHRTHSIRKSSYCCYDKSHHQHKKTLKWWILQLLTLFPIQTMRQNCSQSEHIPCSTYSCLGQYDCTVGGATECETRWIEIKQNVLTFITCCNTIWRWYWNKKWINKIIGRYLIFFRLYKWKSINEPKLLYAYCIKCNL